MGNNYKTIVQLIDESSDRPVPSKNIMDALDYKYDNETQSTTIAGAINQSINSTSDSEEGYKD